MRARPRITALSMIALAMTVSVLAVPAAKAAVAGTTAGTVNRTLYVNATSPRCSDAGAGSQAVPFCTIQAAANVAVAGQTVGIEQSARKRLPFTRPVTFTRSGTSAAPIVFRGIAAGPDGLPELKSPAGVTPVTFRDVHDVTIESLRISYGGNADGVDVKGSSDIMLNSVSLASSGTVRGKSAPVRIDDRSSAVTLSQVAFHAGSTRGRPDAPASESFRLGEPPVKSPVIGSWARRSSVRPASVLSAHGWTAPPFGVEIFSPADFGGCDTSCWGGPFTYKVDFGDHTPLVAAKPDVWISHSYKHCGIYPVTITATDADGFQLSFFTMVYLW